MVPVGITYFFLWYVPPIDDQPPYVKYIYYQCLYLCFQASLTVEAALSMDYLISDMFYVSVHPCSLYCPHHAHEQ